MAGGQAMLIEKQGAARFGARFFTTVESRTSWTEQL